MCLLGIFRTTSEDLTFFKEFFEETFIGQRGFSLKMYSPLVFVIHQLPFSFAFTHYSVFMYYCSCLHNWQWPRVQNRWLASPWATHQRLALKWLPQRKCMAKLWNIITPFPYFQMKRFSDIFVIKCFWGISSTRTYYNYITYTNQCFVWCT